MAPSSNDRGPKNFWTVLTLIIEKGHFFTLVAWLFGMTCVIKMPVVDVKAFGLEFVERMESAWGCYLGWILLFAVIGGWKWQYTRMNRLHQEEIARLAAVRTNAQSAHVRTTSSKPVGPS